MFSDEVWQKLYQGLIFFGALCSACGVAGSWLYTSKVNRAKDLRIRDLIDENGKMLIGGNSFCYILLMPTANGMANVMLYHDEENKYPLYKIDVSIEWDTAKHYSEEQYKKLTHSDLEKLHANALKDMIHNHTELPTVDELTPDEVLKIGQVTYPSSNKATYTIHFKARNGIWVQHYHVYPTPKGSVDYIHYKVTKGFLMDGELLKEYKSTPEKDRS